MSDFELFDGKTINDLTKDIYDNSKNKRLQLDLLIQEIHGYIQTAEDVLQLAPIIKEFYDVSIKNDEHLVKLASVFQRIMSKTPATAEEFSLLSDTEKEELMETLHNTVDELQKENDKLDIIRTENKRTLGEN